MASAGGTQKNRPPVLFPCSSPVLLEFDGSKLVFPVIEPTSKDAFLKRIESSKKKWIIFQDPKGNPRLVLNSDSFIRNALFEKENFNPLSHCHRPIIVRDGQSTLGSIVPWLKVNPEHAEDDVIDEDIILLWGEEKKVITGSDILGRLLRGIVRNKGVPFKKPKNHYYQDE